jgi:hypothetical protein
MKATAALLLAVVAIAVVGQASAARGDSRDHALLRSIRAGMKTDLVSVQIKPLARKWQAPSRQGQRMLYFRSAATTPAGKVLDEWYATLIGGVYNDQCGRKADHCLAVYDGNLGGGGIGRSGARRPFAGRRTLARKIRAAFAGHGLHVSSISFEHPDALAPVVTVMSRHPQQAVDVAGKVEARLPYRHVNGLFFQMLDGHGRVFYANGSSAKYSEGWVRPGLRVPNLP